MLADFPWIHLVTDYLSTFVGMWLYYRYAKGGVKLTNDQKILYLFGAILGALIGSRLLAALEDPYLFFHPPTWLYYYANKTIIGGIAGGIIGIEIAKKFLKIRGRTGDSTIIPLFVAIIIGRIGCEAVGVMDGTIGSVCHYMWCFDQGDGLPRHPIPLYEILELSLLLPIVGYYLKRNYFKEGFLFRVAICIYFMSRFFFEFLKDVKPLAISLSAIQIVCILFTVYYIFEIIYYKLYTRRTIR